MPILVINTNTIVATVRYVLRYLFNVFQYRYNRDAITNLATSNEPAIIITSTDAPANSLLKPLTE